MTREEKATIIEELTQKFNASTYFYITDASGLSVVQINGFRKLCHENNVEYKVCKNTLIKKAFELSETDYSKFNDILVGFSGILFAKGAGNAPAVLIKDFRKDGNDKPVLKGAFIDSEFFIGDQHLIALSKLKSKNELIGEIIALLQSPVTNVISALQSGKHKLAGIVKALGERGS